VGWVELYSLAAISANNRESRMEIITSDELKGYFLLKDEVMFY
jgi:hypothetical protein